jgi:hypothetical protein
LIRMTYRTENARTSAVCSAVDADGLEEECARQPRGGTDLFQRQIAAAGLDEIAEKAAAGTVLGLDDAIRLSGINLPLLGRIVQLRPASERATPFERAASAADLPRQIAQPLTDWATFCRELVATRDELAKSIEPAAWYPEVSRPPDENGASHNDNYTGVEALRAVALARLLLPANVEIVAPLATLGAKLAHVALDFGATHLGYVSCDGQPLENPLAVSAADLKEFERSCPPTTLKEEE